MAQIDDRLLDCVLDALGDDPLANELREAQRPASNGAASITVTIPEKLAAHVADACMIGASRQLMTSGRDAGFYYLQRLGDEINSIVPELVLDNFRSHDVTDAMEVLTSANPSIWAENRGYMRKSVHMEADGTNGRKYRARTWGDMDREQAETLAEGLRELNSRLAPMPGADNEELPAGPKM